MGRFYANEVDNYGGNGRSSFFSLKDDGDVARVRFMYNTAEDIVGYAVHEVVDNDGKKRCINCLRSYNEPKSKCPLCAADNFQKAKLYIPLYDIDADEVKIWERGKTYFSELSSNCARYSSADSPLVAQVFEIERHGKKNDPKTTYGTYPIGSPDDTRLEDLPEIPEVLGRFVFDKTEEEIKEFLATGRFDSADSGRREPNEDEPIRRTPSRRRGESF